MQLTSPTNVAYPGGIAAGLLVAPPAAGAYRLDPLPASARRSAAPPTDRAPRPAGVPAAGLRGLNPGRNIQL